MSETPISEENTRAQSNAYLIPIAILIAGLCIAGAIVVTQGRGVSGGESAGRTIEAEVLPITKKDHVFGSREADVFLIEYSDYRCGYCGLFHATVKQILEKYEGRVAWVYRHTPYQPGGKEAAVASECIAELAGEDAFWQFTERALANTRILSTEWHRSTAVELGIEEQAFSACLSSGKYDALIAEQSMNAQELGGQGTPFNVLLTRKGEIIKFSGAQPIGNVEVFVNRALRTLE